MKPLHWHVATVIIGSFPVWLGFIPGYALEGKSVSTHDQQQILHVLDRITFGPRPGDLEAVQRMGLQNFIQQQLHPETIDDSAVEAELQQFKDLQPKATPAAPVASSAQDEIPMMQAGAKIKPIRKDKSKSSAAVGELEKAKLIRAVQSPRQLQEVLVDFWTNHFNIDVGKDRCGDLIATDDREVIRPHIWGKFRDLLKASAKSPAMLDYLDNAKNTARKGNENYGREIMELHTLGVDGGYTQKDVQEVARCFTGWTYDRSKNGFAFKEGSHDKGVKTVLGHVIPANGGLQDGETVLDLLCASPATAHHISRELCQRFVSDDPPEPLVQRIAHVFQSTDGDLRAVVEAILESPEFLSPSDYGNKIKSPLEFAVSAVRATGSTFVVQVPSYDKLAQLEGTAVIGRNRGAADKLCSSRKQSLNWRIFEMGEPLFGCTPPTGYPEISRNWMGPGALIERFNFVMALTQQNVWDVKFDPEKVVAKADLGQPDTAIDQWVTSLLPGNISAGTRAVLDRAVLTSSGQSQTVDSTKLVALILGSPEFQRK